MTFRTLVADTATPISEIAEFLGKLSPDERMDALFNLGRSDQRMLYEKAAHARPATLSDFVPASKGPGDPVVHEGKNSLPLPGFRRFKKPFCRASGEGRRLFGYNEGIARPFVGPGYFVAYETSDRPEWSERGGVVVDYFQVPDEPVPTGWPEVVENSKGLGWFVFHEIRDFMRRVAEGVTIGSAYKVESKMDQYFILVRQD